MSLVSIIVPLYNGAEHIESTLRSIVGQTYADLEIIVSDDAGSDNARELVERMQVLDGRIAIVGDGVNRGTLGARKQGVAASTGDYVMFVDQDDELAPDAVSQLVSFARSHPADIYHFPAEVIPENDAARDAAAGMQGFLTPPVRMLLGPDILAYQVKLEDGFDWHLHHKMYVGDLAREAYGFIPDARLVEADDFYASFIVAALARTYRAMPNPSLYRYHLGRGETFGDERTVESVLKISANNREAYRLIEAFAASPGAPRRDDWDARLGDAMRCLLDYPMNEWNDALDEGGKLAALPQLLRDWPAEYVCAELWRYCRDASYALMVAQRAGVGGARMRSAAGKDALRQLEEAACFRYAAALEVERTYGTEASGYARYQEHKRMALIHAHDAGLIGTSLKERASTVLRRIAGVPARAVRKLGCG